MVGVGVVIGKEAMVGAGRKEKSHLVVCMW